MVTPLSKYQKQRELEDAERLYARLSDPSWPGFFWITSLLYEMTVRENVGFGFIENIQDSERVEQAARASGADAMIEALPGQ